MRDRQEIAAQHHKLHKDRVRECSNDASIEFDLMRAYHATHIYDVNNIAAAKGFGDDWRPGSCGSQLYFRRSEPKVDSSPGMGHCARHISRSAALARGSRASRGKRIAFGLGAHLSAARGLD